MKSIKILQVIKVLAAQQRRAKSTVVLSDFAFTIACVVFDSIDSIALKNSIETWTEQIQNQSYEDVDPIPTQGLKAQWPLSFTRHSTPTVV